ncbi:MAG: YidC/Oxa1 family membrane protein insertase [Chloroflexi bacterium]|nr:MAG: YidC/Oxa1 family membrane protein insertase [Chloroflexota bacterium]TMD51236.1 MAG: YidC/Oxa1 family membrane protein insertase [Chloroflexota bacterium]
MDLRHIFDFLAPVKALWANTFLAGIQWGLIHLYHTFSGVPGLEAIGAYGLAIIALTILVKLLLAPLYQLQLSMSRKTMLEQRKLAPEVAKLRKKYKGDAQKLNTATMELYKEHGVNPLGGFMGCLPAVVQFPILTALYWAFLQFHVADAHFLFIPSLVDSPSKHLLIPGIPLLPTVAFAIIPLLAAASTYVQAKMMQQPPNPLASEQELQTQQMTRSMQVMMPVMIAYFAVVTPAGLGLYWFVSNCVAIIQQYFVTGWGQLWRPGN